MSTTYAQRQNTAQKKDAPSASSVLDASSQSESLQRKAELANGAVQRVGPPRPNNTGMPDNLKAGIESLSGFSMDDVRVHYNSSKPATVQALAYTQGTDIHVAPGQEKHLPHEAWHVAQQMAGRVSPTTNINGMPVNDNAALEHEADVMGEKAVLCNGREKNKKISKPLDGLINATQCVKKRSQTKAYAPRKTSSKTRHTQVKKRDTLAEKFSSREKIRTLSPIFKLRPRSETHPKRMPKIEDIQKLLGEDYSVRILGDKQVLDDGGSVQIVYNYILNDKKTALCCSSETLGLLGDYLMQKKGNMQYSTTFYVHLTTCYKSFTLNQVDLCLCFSITLNRTPGSEELPGYMLTASKTQRHNPSELLESNICQDKDIPPDQFPFHHYTTEPNESRTLLERTYRRTDRGNKKEPKKTFGGDIVDSYAKLVAEGARFKCVRKHIGEIRDNSIFYDPVTMRAVTFENLWKAWSDFKRKRFNIPDFDIIRWLIKTNSPTISKIEPGCFELSRNDK